jgi:polyisoprenoid-binding protein YceI
VPIEFTFDGKDGAAWLKGTAKIKRLDFGVGQGEWQDTSTVGNDVQVRFALRLKSAT